jgi:hypothetical protein
LFFDRINGFLSVCLCHGIALVVILFDPRCIEIRAWWKLTRKRGKEVAPSFGCNGLEITNKNSQNLGKLKTPIHEFQA